MPRPKGSKNKPKGELMGLQYEKLPDLLTPEEAAIWLRTSRGKIMKQIRENIIPQDCYEMNGPRYQLKKYKLAVLKGLRPAS